MPSTMSLKGHVFNDSGSALEGVDIKVFKKNTTATALNTETLSDGNGAWTANWDVTDTTRTQVDIQGTSGTSVFRWKYDDRIAVSGAFIEDLHIIPERDFAFKFEGATTANRTITFQNSAGTVALLEAAQTFTNTVTVGVDGTGKDVKFYGDSAGAYMEWDESEDQLRIMGASADATTSTGKLLLATSLTNINANDVIGKIDFQAPHETGTDAVAIAASIQAVAQGTFSASVNATDLIFATGHSEAATEKFRITSQGELGIGGATYGSSGDVLTSGGAGAAPTWATPTTGDITGVTAGVGLSGGGASGSVTLTLDLSELSTVTPADGDFFATLDSDGANEQKTTTTALATLFAGTNLTATNSVISVDDSFVTNSGDDTMTGALTVSNTTDTTSGASGAIHTTGGLGVTKKVFIGGGSATARVTMASTGAAGTLVILDSDSDNSSGTGADAVIRFRENGAAAFEVGHDASSSVFTIGANDDAGGNDALRITDATPPVVSFNTSLGSDFDYVCDGCGRHEATIFTCCSKVEWHDDVMDFRGMSLRENSAMDYMERVGVIERTTNNAGDPEVFTSFDMVYFVGSMAWQNRQRMDRLFNKLEQRLQKLEAV